MKLTEKQKKLWDKVSTLLISRLRQKAYENKSGLKFSHAKNPVLSECIQQAADVNSKEQKIFMVAFQIFVQALDLQIQNNKKTNLAILGFFDIPEVSSAINELSEIVKAVVSDLMTIPETPIFEQYLEIPFSLESMNRNIIEWVAQQYSPVDVRVSLNDHRYQRRMDSLARLLSPPPSLSVCVAVTLDLSMEPRLVIGTNVSRNGKQQEILDVISRRLDTIKRFMTHVCAASIEPSQLDQLAENLLKQLFNISEAAIPPDELLKAAKKIIDAICFDGVTFDPIEKLAFLNHSPSTIVLPRIKVGGEFQMQINHLTSKGGWLETDFALPMIPRETNIKNIHAEQLIARYLFEELKIQLELKRPLIFGLSKLCCVTCVEHLNSYPVTLRGHHGQAYQGVVNLHNGASPAVSSARHAATQPWSSPKDTPDKRLKRKTIDSKQDYNDEPLLRASGKCLFFSNDFSKSKEKTSPAKDARIHDFFDINRRKAPRYQSEKYMAEFQGTETHEAQFENLTLHSAY